MPPREIGFSDLRDLVKRGWPLIIGLGLLFGVATLLAILLLVPPMYHASARLIVQPSGDIDANRSIELYTSLIESDVILETAAERLIEDGVLPTGAVLRLGRELTIETVSAIRKEGPMGGSFIVVTGQSEDSEVAAAIANAVCAVFIEKRGSMLRSGAATSEAVLIEELAPTRERLEGLELELSNLEDEYQSKEEDISTAWDRRIASAKKTAGANSAEYRAATRRLMEEAVTGFDGLGDGAAQVGARLQELVSVRSQLAQTPRVLTLEKAVSDETLAELIAEEKEIGLFDATLTSQEANSLYAELSLNALRIETALKSLAGGDSPELAALLAQLESIELNRASGLTTLLDAASLEVRTLRRRRTRALEDIVRDRDTAVADLERRHKQLSDLEAVLSQGLNEALVERLLEDSELVDLAARAVPRKVSQPRQLPLKTAAAAFLGAMLGLMIALFRSASNA